MYDDDKLMCMGIMMMMAGEPYQRSKRCGMLYAGHAVSGSVKTKESTNTQQIANFIFKCNYSTNIFLFSKICNFPDLMNKTYNHYQVDCRGPDPRRFRCKFPKSKKFHFLSVLKDKMSFSFFSSVLDKLSRKVYKNI